MALVEIDIVDTSFAHAPGMSWYNVPRYIRWVRGSNHRKPIRFFTDRMLGQVDNYAAEFNVALLIEPVGFDETGYNLCLDKLAKFDHVLTYDRSFLQRLGPKGLFYPIGGCWLRPEDRKLWHKDGMVSIIASEKRQTHGHQLRHAAIERWPSVFDVFGRAYNPVDFKVKALSRFMYSVAIENCQTDDLFTEKIIDCFLTGTVPIYWGTHKLGDYFNLDGVIQFETLDDLEAVWKIIGTSDYESRLPAIQDNRERALRYMVAEDWIFRQYPFLLS